MFVRVGKIRVTCAQNCDSCPMETSPIGWKTLTESPCCNNIWIPASYLSQATGKDRTINKSKAMALFLKSLGVL